MASQSIELLTFQPRHEASFLCPESQLDSLLKFLASQNVTVIRREPGTTSDAGTIFIVEVSDVNAAQGARLQKEFNQFLSSDNSAAS